MSLRNFKKGKRRFYKKIGFYKKEKIYFEISFQRLRLSSGPLDVVAKWCPRLWAVPAM